MANAKIPSELPMHIRAEHGLRSNNIDKTVALGLSHWDPNKTNGVEDVIF